MSGAIASMYVPILMILAEVLLSNGIFYPPYLTNVFALLGKHEPQTFHLTLYFALPANTRNS